MSPTLPDDSAASSRGRMVRRVTRLVRRDDADTFSIYVEGRKMIKIQVSTEEEKANLIAASRLIHDSNVDTEMGMQPDDDRR